MLLLSLSGASNGWERTKSVYRAGEGIEDVNQRWSGASGGQKGECGGCSEDAVIDMGL